MNNIKNIIFSAWMMSAVLGSSVVVAGVPPMMPDMDAMATILVGGVAGTTAGAMVLAKKGAALGTKKGAALGRAAGPVGILAGGVTGAVVGGVTGAAIGWSGLVVVKAFRNEMTKR